MRREDHDFILDIQIFLLSYGLGSHLSSFDLFRGGNEIPEGVPIIP